MKITKILVANRGEIALRIMRSAHEMNIDTVAVYSDADRLAPHTRYARQAVCIGPAPSSESYLNISKIIEAAQISGAQAIHPGYGFLSENAVFAQAVADAGLIFIGPSPQSMALMGNKLTAKEAVSHYGVPLVPGSKGAIDDIGQAKIAADTAGYPVLIKAGAGGGGKGMRIVENEQEFESQMLRAQSEAQSAFGDSTVFVEKYIRSPKHIEIQILADQNGNLVHVFERECSIQRRHQKVMEEAPSIAISENLRQQMGQAALQVARACGYYGAGTVEFIVDQNHQFYFLEMNTRLQVEHPVSELITGLDLVREQILIAQGDSLTFSQADLSIRGHAIEVRVYAEDPANGFLPDIGKLQIYQRPQGPGIRVDDGFEQGMQIPIYYDPMIAKLTVWGADRPQAIARMLRAIDEYKIVGIATTLDFCRFVLEHPVFIDGSFGTDFASTYFDPKILLENPDLSDCDKQIAAIAAAFIFEQQSHNLPKSASHDAQIAHSPNQKFSNWQVNRSR